MADFTYPNFNVSGFPYQNMVQQMLASMQNPTQGSYQRFGGTGLLAGAPQAGSANSVSSPMPVAQQTPSGGYAVPTNPQYVDPTKVPTGGVTPVAPNYNMTGTTAVPPSNSILKSAPAGLLGKTSQSAVTNGLAAGADPASVAAMLQWGAGTGRDMSSSIAANAQWENGLRAARQAAPTARDPNFNGNIMDVPWDQLGNLRTLANLGNGPLALRFTTPSNIGANGSFQVVQTPGQQEAMRLATLSTQPGMFGTGAGGNTQLSTSPYFNFTVGGNGPGALAPDTTYYLNLVNRNAYNGPDLYGNNYGINVDYQHGGNG